MKAEDDGQVCVPARSFIEIVKELEDFYKKMFRLFDGGNLGGLRIIAEKKQM